MSWLRDLHDDQSVRLTNIQIYRLLGCFIVSILPQFGNVPLWLLLASGGLIAWRFQIQIQGVPLPHDIVKLLLGMALFLSVYVDKNTLAGKDAGTALMVGLIAIKFLELRGRRDYMVLVFVLYFMSITVLLFEQSIELFAYVMISCGLLTINLVALYLPDSGVIPTKSAVFACRLLLQSLPLALVLFLFFPRLDHGFELSLGGASTGLPSKIRAGSFNEIRKDSGMVFRADFPRGGQPPVSSLYWRAFVLSDYDANQNEWSIAARNFNPNSSTDLEGGEAVEQHITLRPQTQQWLFALDYPKSTLLIDSVKPDAAYVLRTDHKLYRKIQYIAISKVNSHPINISPSMYRMNLSIFGAVDDDVRNLAASFRSAKASDQEVVDNALNYFRQNHFEYTTRSEDYGDAPLHEFLFEKRRGFCEHFASAFAVLMRLANIPARVVAGYQGGEYNPYGRFLIVRNLNAHAWCEVYITGKGWTRVDPTLTASSVDVPTATQLADPSSEDLSVKEERGSENTSLWMRHLMQEGRFRWELAEEMWDRWVLSYNPESQADLLKDLGLQKLAWELFIVVASVALGVTVHFVARTLRWTKTPDERLQLIYTEFCIALEDAGVFRRNWESATRYAERAARILPDAAEPITKFSHDYAFLRYGKIDHLEPALEPLREILEQVKEAVEKVEVT